jgi:hypothetical protein
MSKSRSRVFFLGSIVAAAFVLSGTGARAQILKTVDRKYPVGWCPMESRATAGADLSFVAPASTVRITFSGNNQTGGEWNAFHLDNVTVVAKSTFDAHNYGPTPGFEFCYDPTIPAGQTTGGVPGAPYYAFNDTGTTEVFVDLFGSNIDGWTGPHVVWDSFFAAPTHPESNSGAVGGSLSLGDAADGDVPVSASRMVSGLVTGQVYVIHAWWWVSPAGGTVSPLTITIDVPCVDQDGDGYVVCGSCNLQAGQSCGDCNDLDSTVHPGVTDTTCNGIDDDCNGVVDDGSPVACQCVQRGTGLVAWWPGEGNANDLQKSGNGTLGGTATFAAGEVGQAFSFDGLGYVQIPDTAALEMTTRFTLEAWIRPDDVNNNRQILSKFGTVGNYAYQFGLAPSGAMRVDVSGDGSTYDYLLSGPGLITAGIWSHVAATFDSGQLRLWVNGNLVASKLSATVTSINPNGVTTPNIGRDPAGIQGFIGRIDEAAIYSRALGAAELQAIIATGSTGACRCFDADRDGYGVDGGVSCWAGTLQDCNDNSASTHPGAPDTTCDGIDQNCSGVADEGYVGSPEGWSATTTSSAPTARTGFVAVSTGSELIVWGGFTGSGNTPTGGVYHPDTGNWTSTTLTNGLLPRHDACGVWTGTNLLIFGGDDGSFALSNGRRYVPSSDSWEAMSGPALFGRSLCSAVWTGSRMLVWGGSDHFGVAMGDGAGYDPDSDTWPISLASVLISPRFHHSAIWTGSKMIVFGGENGNGAQPSGAAYDLAANTWSTLSTSGAPSARTRHTAVWTGSKMIVWGGWDRQSTYYNDGGIYDPLANGGTGAWAPVSTTGAPSARVDHVAVWDPLDGVMIVWGGRNASGVLNDGARFNPDTNIWTPLASDGAPTARENAAGVWITDTTGVSRLIVWGGDDNAGTLFRTGGRYNTFPYTCGLGACQRQSLSTCTAGVNGYGCTPGTGQPEVCNGADDDCDGSIDNGVPPPSGGTDLAETRSGTDAELSWTAASSVTGYDAVKGSLDALRSTGGNFMISTTACLGNDLAGTTVTDTQVLSPGSGLWHLIRAVNACSGAGSYGGTLRDSGIAASPNACP